MLQAVPPVPPPVPNIPFDPNLVMNQIDSKGIVVIVLASLAVATVILWPIVRALVRRLEGRAGGDPALRGELDQVQHRLAEVDSLQLRVAELEERLEFAERLLAQTREPGRLQR